MKSKRLIALLAVLSLLLMLLPGSFALAEEAAEEPASDAPETAAEGSMSAQLEAIFTTEDLLTATIEDLSAAMERGSLTSVRLTQMYLDRIEAYDHSLDLNTMITLNENALAEAAAADEARAAGQTGLLLGLPILVEDNINVGGLRTTNGQCVQKQTCILRCSLRSCAAGTGCRLPGENQYGNRCSNRFLLPFRCRRPSTQCLRPVQNTCRLLRRLCSGGCRLLLRSGSGLGYRQLYSPSLLLCQSLRPSPLL